MSRTLSFIDTLAFLLTLLTLLTFLTVSCSISGPSDCTDSSASGEQLIEMRLTALDGAGKTVLVDGQTVLWQAGDEITVLDGGGNRRFRTEEGGALAVFDGSAAETAGLMMVYPYSTKTYKEDGRICLELPQTQTATEGSFQRGANVSLAQVNSDGCFCARNLCALVCLRISRTDVVSATISSRSGSPLAGRVCAAFDGEGAPYVDRILAGKSSVTLEPLSGTIAPGCYYVPVLPGLLASGLSVKLTLSSGVVATREITSPINLPRAGCYEISTASGLSFEKTDERIVVIYGDSITHINVFDYLQSLLDTKACDKMDADTLKHISYRVVMAGRSGERPLQIVCRQGALPLYIRGPFTLNALSNSFTQIGESFYTTMDEDAQDLGTPSSPVNVDLGGESTTGWTGCTNPFVLDGIECTVKRTLSEESSTGQFNSIARNVSVSSERYFGDDYVPVQTHLDHAYPRPYISTVYMGTNGKYIYENPTPDGHTWEQLGDFVQLMIDHAPSTRWVVCGYHSRARWTQGGTDYMSGRFGDIYIDLKREGINKVNSINSRIGYTLTPEDQTYLLNDEWPAGWQDLSNIVHPSPTGHKAYATLLFEKMEELGYLEP